MAKKPRPVSGCSCNGATTVCMLLSTPANLMCDRFQHRYYITHSGVGNIVSMLSVSNCSIVGGWSLGMRLYVAMFAGKRDRSDCLASRT